VFNAFGMNPSSGDASVPNYEMEDVVRLGFSSGALAGGLMFLKGGKPWFPFERNKWLTMFVLSSAGLQCLSIKNNPVVKNNVNKFMQWLSNYKYYCDHAAEGEYQELALDGFDGEAK
jgi:hypothetical protein